MARAGSFEIDWLLPSDRPRELVIDPARLERADLIILQRFFPMPLTRDVLDAAFSSGRPVIYELDDLLTDLPLDNPHLETARLCEGEIQRVLRDAAMVSVSTRELARCVEPPVGGELRVIPNRVDTRMFRRLPRETQGRVTIGYFGTSTHESDLRRVEPALLRLASRFADRVRFVFGGCVTPALARLPGAQVISMQPDYARFAEILSNAGIDIGLAPLRDHPFNRCKSAIKWMEYAACGIAPVVADLTPYAEVVDHARTGWLTPDDSGAWLDALERLVSDEALRRQLADSAWRQVNREHALELHAGEITRVYRPWLDRRSSARPRTSIVVPVFNRLDLTRGCVEALLSHTIDDEVELIVVDDGSTDGTASWLAGLGARVRVLRNPQNLGFARTCNRGAEAAHGEQIVFLNNDTLPQPGWLAPLIERVESEPDVGIVGARLLYADGTIQHAGLAISRSGLPYHIYRGAPNDLPAVTRPRDLQAVTGACMLVRREIFQVCGGFDTGYRNGSEDVELCLRAREAGWRVVYEPRCEITHLESQSPGRKDHDTPNTRRFLERWGPKLIPDEARLLLADDWMCSWSDGAGATRPITGADERRRWTEVARIESVLEQQGVAGLRAAPPDPALLPDDAETRRWCAQLSSLASRAVDFDGTALAQRATRPGSAKTDTPGANWQQRAIESLLARV
jgi:GT2 family glycosyltransferase/glycosyltransferase involved in cell wall biosynthesis